MHLCVSVGARRRLQLLHHMVTMDPTARRVYDSGELYNFLAIDAARTGDGFVPTLHWRTWWVFLVARHGPPLSVAAVHARNW
jgi:hypothetical protein